MIMATSLGYTNNALIRHTVEHDPEALAKAAENPKSALILLAGDQPILQAGEPGTSLLPFSVLDRLPEHKEQVFLGLLGGRPVIATLAAPDTAALFQDPAYTVADLRSIASQGLVRTEELGILAMAKSMLLSLIHI